MELLLRIGLDDAVTDFVAGLHTAWLDTAMVFLTRLANGGWFWIALALVLLCFSKTRRAGIAVLCALLLSLLFCNTLLKHLVNRPRPFAGQDALKLLIPKPQDASFPSGHTSASFAAATVLTVYFKKLAPLFLTLATLIGFSRIYLGVHFPTDVLGGLIVGVLCGIGAVLLVKTFSPGGRVYRALSSKKIFSSKNRE